MKTFYSIFMMAALAICMSISSCAPDDEDIEPESYVFEVAEHYEDVVQYSLDDNGSYVELAEAGKAICRIAKVTRAVAGVDYDVFSGSWMADHEGNITLKGNKLQSSFKKGDKDIKVKVDGIEVNATKVEKPQDTSDEAKNCCNTWKIGRVLCDGSTITISSPSYDHYFGVYGYPVQITFTSLNTFYCEMSKCNVVGSWKWNGKKMDVWADPFLSIFEWVVDDEVALKFTIKCGGEQHDFKVYLTPVK